MACSCIRLKSCLLPCPSASSFGRVLCYLVVTSNVAVTIKETVLHTHSCWSYFLFIQISESLRMEKKKKVFLTFEKKLVCRKSCLYCIQAHLVCNKSWLDRTFSTPPPPCKKLYLRAKVTLSLLFTTYSNKNCSRRRRRLCGYRKTLTPRRVVYVPRESVIVSLWVLHIESFRIWFGPRLPAARNNNAHGVTRTGHIAAHTHNTNIKNKFECVAARREKVIQGLCHRREMDDRPIDR